MSTATQNRASSEPRQTLEQQRAQDAWHCAQEAAEKLKKHKGDYAKYEALAKGLPALVMNSGFMQTIVFLREKSLDHKGQPKLSDHHHWLGEHLRSAINKRFPDVPVDFEGFMKKLMSADSHKYRMITAEAFAWLKWLRQMAAARKGGD